MNTAEKIVVMQAFEDGKEIEYFCDESTSPWRVTNNPEWCWDSCDYRIKPDPKPESLEDRAKAAYGEYDIVMFEFDDRNRWVMPDNYLHIDAQSMKDFAGYVYEIEGRFLPANRLPTWAQTGVIVHPIAVLFEKVAG